MDLGSAMDMPVVQVPGMQNVHIRVLGMVDVLDKLAVLDRLIVLVEGILNVHMVNIQVMRMMKDILSNGHTAVFDF